MTTLHTPDTSTDTICAISTPPGIGGIAIVRISGPQAITIADSIWQGKPLTQARSHTAHLGHIINPADDTIADQAVATVYIAPHSFTGEDVVELSIHGSRFIQRETLNILTANGCRLAQPGEFTRRAFISGKMDLAEAEAVADVIASNSRAAHRIAMSQMRGEYSRKLTALRDKLIDLSALLELELDFSEEDVEFASRQKLRQIAAGIHEEVTRLHRSFASGSAIKDGIPVAITGATNAGKSSLMNTLVGDDRAIVSDIHGTTRDTIEESIEIGDYLFRFIDTAGLRDTSDTIEQKGIERTLRAIGQARVIILVIDPSAPDAGMIQDIAAKATHLIIAINKTDIHPTSQLAQTLRRTYPSATTLEISAKKGIGTEELRSALHQIAERENGNADEGILVTNARHAEALKKAAVTSAAIITGLDNDLTGDLIALDLRETIHHLSTITSTITSTDILSTIFSRFCIGK